MERLREDVWKAGLAPGEAGEPEDAPAPARQAGRRRAGV